jgi:SPOR domain
LTLGLWPETVPLDPDDGADSPALDAILRGPAAALTAVVLLAGEQARASGWAARTAVALARRWPGPRRTVLLDLDVAQPTLHELTGVANDEGVLDVLELGASLHRVAVPVAGGTFAVLPAGAFAGDGETAVLQSDAWSRILYDAAARRETLLLYVPAESAAAAALVERAGAVLVVADRGEARRIVERLPRRYGVLAALEPQVLEPQVLEPQVRAAAGAATEKASDRLAAAAASDVHARRGAVGGRAARAALIAAVRRRQRGARLVRRESAESAVVAAEPADAAVVAAEPAESAIVVAAPTEPAVVAAEPAEPISTLPVVPVAAGGGVVARDVRLATGADDVALDIPAWAVTPRVPPAPPRFAHPIVWTIGVVLLLSLIAGGAHFFAGRFRRAEQAASPEPAPPAPVTPALTPQNPVEPGDALAYSVAVAAHQNLARAFELVDALRAAQPDLSFYVSPLERNGAVHYHVMAGPVADSATALALRDTLLVRRVKTTSTPTDIRHTPLALLIGDYSTQPEAERQIAELRRLDIPAYLLVGLAADSAPLYRVFVGGFAGPVEADVARQLLRAAGVRDRLINRTRSSTR